MNMKRALISQSSPSTITSRQLLPIVAAPLSYRCLHASPFRAANPLPNTAAGPPPSAPIPAASQYGERVDRRRRQAELLKRGQDIRGSQMKPGSAMKKRFWKDVNVKQDPGMENECIFWNVGTAMSALDAFLYRRMLTKRPRQMEITLFTLTTAPSKTPPLRRLYLSLPPNLI